MQYSSKTFVSTYSNHTRSKRRRPEPEPIMQLYIVYKRFRET
jgi:hypothetical protein